MTELQRQTKAVGAGDPKIQELQSEIEKLKEKVAQTKEKYSKVSTDMIGSKSVVRVSESLKLLSSDACHLLSVELGSPLEMVVLETTLPLFLMDSSQNIPFKRVSAVKQLGVTGVDSKEQKENIFIYTCPENVYRLEIKVTAPVG